ncbi:MAG: methionine gamma-lyase family protein, partial [Agathobacter sp.]
GYNDLGREAIESVYKDIFKSESALVRSQFISGSHALTVALFALLRPGDRLLSITGTPYDTLHEVIGIKENASSLKSFGILYDEIDLLNDDGRICIITFHSLEDRIVKTIFKNNENPCTCPSDFPICVCGKKSKGHVVTRKPILPSEEELEKNSRSKSAKLRVFEKQLEK